MALDKSLNLVVPVEREDGSTVYVHSTPISRDVFNRFWMVMAKAFNAIYTQGIGMYTAPRVAAKLLRAVAADIPGQAEATEQGLIAEMRRLSNVLVPSGSGWSPMPIDVAISQNILNADDADEVENAVAFFILASAMHKKKDAALILPEAVKIWSAQITSLSCMEFAASLQTSTRAGTSGATATPSSIPS